MVARLGTRLPTFTREEAAKLKGSADFFGLNHYGSQFVRASLAPADYDTPNGTASSYWTDYEASSFHTDDMPRAASVWLYGVPWGLRKLLNWVEKRYNSGNRVPIYVTENGWSTPGSESWQEGVVDDGRVLFYANYTGEVQRAINEDGIDVRGYFAWSLMDNFEWERGFSERFGLVYTDFVTQERHIKASGKWLKATMAANEVADPCPYLNLSSYPAKALGCMARRGTEPMACEASLGGEIAGSGRQVASTIFIAATGVAAIAALALVAHRRGSCRGDRFANGPAGADESPRTRMVDAVEEMDDGL